MMRPECGGVGAPRPGLGSDGPGGRMGAPQGSAAPRRSPPPLTILILRFIPAHAGNTPRPSPRRRSRTVHPRSRGEHEADDTLQTRSTGSSPLTRGTPAAPRRDPQHHRFIPAHVGNTPPVSFRSTPVTVHPRSRGEHTASVLQVHAGYGSSPLTWGTRHPVHGVRAENRFIPAHVGNTCPRWTAPSSPAVHPRSRGEHGHSPSAVLAEVRFIPAHVGNTDLP